MTTVIISGMRKTCFVAYCQEPCASLVKLMSRQWRRVNEALVSFVSGIPSLRLWLCRYRSGGVVQDVCCQMQVLTLAAQVEDCQVVVLDPLLW
jgi:hypothetical protein